MTNLIRAGRVALMLLCVATAAADARADVKIKSRQTMQGQSYDNATYIKGKRQRTESMGGQSVVIQQCDLRRDLQLMPAMKAYTVNPYDTAAAAASAPASGTRQTVERTQGGLVTSTVTTKDTGERKQMFGYTARHLVITVETKSSPDSCNPVDSKMVTDGWYIDAAFQLDCDAERAARYYNPQQAGGCRDRYEMKTVGTARRGFPLWEKMTMFDKDGRESFSMVNEVVELSQATLDASLFEPPADFREVKDFSAAAMMSAARSQGNAGDDSARPSSSGQAQQTATEVGAKQPGVIRLGLAGVQTGTVGDNLSAARLAAAVRDALANGLRGATVEVVMLESSAEAEARRKGCDFVVYANVTHKKGGGGFGGMFGKVATVATGIGSVGDTSGGGGSATANVKQKDELTLDIKLQAPGNAAPAATQQFKSKAKSAGEDIITPAVEQAARMINETVK
ncbi:MAG TPA: hypothetical protein VF297_07750 [Pyrinomonadaceae bacterium]